MDKLFKVLCVITIMIMISGCSLDVNSDMEIKENGNFKYDVSVIFDKELINNVINISNYNGIYRSNSDKEIEEYLNNKVNIKYYEGFNKKIIINEKNAQIVYSYNINDINDISDNNKKEVILNDFDSEKKFKNIKIFTKIKDKYYCDFKYISNLNNNDNIVDYNITFNVNLPYRVNSSNADVVSSDGKSLKWNINSSSDKDIVLSFKLKGGDLLKMIVLSAVDMVLIAGITTLIIRNRRQS